MRAVLKAPTDVPAPPYDNGDRDRLLYEVAHTVVDVRQKACTNARWVRGVALAVFAAAAAVLTAGAV